MSILRRGFGINKRDVDDLQRHIPHHDSVAAKQKLPVHHGSIEAAEHQIPWLRRRRRFRGLG
jgi:hypothetical protein